MAIMTNLYDSAYSKVLKDIQKGRLESMLSEQSNFIKYVQKNFKKGNVEGRKIRRPIKIQQGMAAVGNINYQGSFKTKSLAKFDEIVVDPKYPTAHWN